MIMFSFLTMRVQSQQENRIWKRLVERQGTISKIYEVPNIAYNLSQIVRNTNLLCYFQTEAEFNVSLQI